MVVAMSFGEWAWHRYFLHGRWVYNHIPMLSYVYEHHAIEHHGEGQNEIIPHIHLTLVDYWFAWLLALIGLTRCLAYGHIEGLAGVVAIATVCLGHMLLWNALHEAIHGLGSEWITRMPGFDSFKRHHEDHHRHVKRNFGVVCIWIDYHLGTLYQAKT